MAVAIDTANIISTTRNAGGTNPVSVGSLTVGAGVNFALVCVSSNGTSGADTCTINGTSATLAVNGNSSGGYSDIAIFTLVSPASGAVSVTLANDRDVAIVVIPLSGVDSGTPLGSWTSTSPASTYTSSPSTGSISGADSTGLFIGALAVLNAGAVSSDGTGFTAISGASVSQGNTRIHVATASGAASATYAPTIAANHSNITGVYVNASSGGGATASTKMAFYRMLRAA